MAKQAELLTEHAVVFGSESNLVGIVTRPKRSIAAESQAVLILNTGIIHRVGHNRMYVDLSRRLAKMGHIVLRFDLSGLGDSSARSVPQQPLDSGLNDIREAIDLLRNSYGVEGVVIVGLCSGANYALIYGGSDPRVRGMVLMDPLIPRTARYYWQYYSTRLLDFTLILSLLTGRHPVWRAFLPITGRAQGESRGGGGNVVTPQVREILRSSYDLVVSSKIKTYAIFTGGLQNRHCYREQIFDAYPGLRTFQEIKVDYFDFRDHMFVQEDNRKELFRRLCGWIRSISHDAEQAVAGRTRLAASDTVYLRPIP